MYTDDISFCQDKQCEMTDCPRNQKNIRDKSIPHSFFVDLPPDCPKHDKLQKTILELGKILDDANPWVDCPPTRCDAPFPLLCDALELLKEGRITKERILHAIAGVAGYGDINKFRNKVIETSNADDYFIGGVYASFSAVEKLFNGE